MEVSLDLKPRYHEAAAQTYEEQTLREVNQKLAPLGLHILFRTNNEPSKENRPHGITIWADAN